MPSTAPRLRRPSAPMIVALLALFVALGGPAEAARLINGGKIKKGTVGSKQLADGGVKARDLAPGAIDRLTATPADSIGPLQLGTNAVTTDALAPNSVLTGNVADGTLTAADLGSNAVGPDEIADNAVGQAQIRPNGVAASEIADGSIDGARDRRRRALGARRRAPGRDASAGRSARLGPDECEAKWVPVARTRPGRQLRARLADLGVAAGPRLHGERHELVERVQGPGLQPPHAAWPRRRRPWPGGDLHVPLRRHRAPRASTGTSRRRPTRPSR